MRICSSVGSVTFAVPLLVNAIALLLPLELFQHDVELVEPLRPRPLVALDPVVDRLERLPVQPVEPLPSPPSHAHRADLAEHAQMLRHLGLGHAERAHEVVDRVLAAGEHVQDLAAPGLGHRIERVRGRRCPCHAEIIYPYRNTSSCYAAVPSAHWRRGSHGDRLWPGGCS